MTASALRVDSVPRHLRPAATAAYASLGAVLVAQTRPHEAIEVLESAHRYVPEHPSFDHVRWMLAQAHLCAASQAVPGDAGGRRAAEPRTDEPKRRDGNDPRLDAIGAHREKARPPLEIIRAHERSRESPAFAGLTDISRSDRICRADWLSTINGTGDIPCATRKQIEGANYRGLCRWLGVQDGAARRLEGRGREIRLPPRLGWNAWTSACQSWGPTATRARVGTRRRRQDAIPLIPTSKPFYYFAQLENAAS